MKASEILSHLPCVSIIPRFICKNVQYNSSASSTVTLNIGWRGATSANIVCFAHNLKFVSFWAVRYDWDGLISDSSALRQFLSRLVGAISLTVGKWSSNSFSLSNKDLTFYHQHMLLIVRHTTLHVAKIGRLIEHNFLNTRLVWYMSPVLSRSKRLLLKSSTVNKGIRMQ